MSAYPEGVPPDVCRHFESIALELIEHGFRRYSADAVLHQVRWRNHVNRGDREFKANNNWTAPLARWFLKSHPEHRAFFQLREASADARPF